MGNKNKSSQLDRMKKLIKSYEEKGEIIKEQLEKSEENSISLQLEAERNKEIARVDEWINSNNQFSGNVPYVAGFGQTVTTHIPQMENMSKYNPNYTYLQPAEALKLSIERTLKSGAPINNITFYDEINWNLNNMGFNSKSPLDIKNTILKMIENK